MKAIHITFILVLLAQSQSWSQIFDFEKNAANAKWQSSTIDSNSNALPNTTTNLTFGKSHGNAGVAIVKKSIMEDGHSYTVLHTHPRWSKNGTIKGWFSKIQSLPEQATLSGKIGFIKPNGEPSTDGARFLIFAHYYINGKEYWEPILDEYKKYTGTLKSFNINLDKYTGKKVYFELRVDTGKTSGQDWAAWVNTKVDHKLLSGNNIQLYREVVTLKTIENLCPHNLVGGDLEFGGNGPKVFGYIDLQVSDDKKNIIAKVKFNARETKSDFLTGKSEVKGYWNIPVYTAPRGKLINGFIDFTNTTTRFESVLKGGGGNELLGGGSDGDPHILNTKNGLDNNGYVTILEVVGDTGGWDISTDDNCRNDTRILKIIFKPIDVEFIEQKQ